MEHGEKGILTLKPAAGTNPRLCCIWEGKRNAVMAFGIPRDEPLLQGRDEPAEDPGATTATGKNIQHREFAGKTLTKPEPGLRRMRSDY